MQHIEIDFEVYKSLTNLRPNEQVTYNDVLRKLLALATLPLPVQPQTKDMLPWVVKGTTFPAGSEFRTTYKGKMYTGIVKNGGLELSDGYHAASPSDAAIHITNSNVNGWTFWQCKLPGSTTFVQITHLRTQV